ARAKQAGRHHGKDRIVARVNDEQIWQSDLSDALPDGVFEATAGQLRQAKLEQLIRQSALRQFLTAHGVRVTQDEVQQAVDELRRNPPSQGCACCRYSSLDAYLSASSMTIAELRAEIEGKQGLNRYLDQLWQKQYAAPGSKTALVAAQRSHASSQYVHG